MEVKNKNNSKVRQSVNTKAGKKLRLAKVEMSGVLERCDAQKESTKTVSKLRAKIALERCDNLVKQYKHKKGKWQK